MTTPIDIPAARQLANLSESPDRMPEIFLAACDEIEALRAAVPRWIPVAERLPDADSEYLVYAPLSNGKPWREILGFDAENQTWWQLDYKHPKPTHWMPLPAGPEGEAR